MTHRKDNQYQYRFQAAAEYVAGYFNVKSVVISDSEGLVVARAGRENFDADVIAAKGLEMIGALDKQIEKIIGPRGEYAVVKTSKDWLTLARVSTLLLIVVAKRDTDDLLHIRIARAMDMIFSHLKNRYPTLIQLEKSRDKKSRKNMEGIHV